MAPRSGRGEGRGDLARDVPLPMPVTICRSTARAHRSSASLNAPSSAPGKLFEPVDLGANDRRAAARPRQPQLLPVARCHPQKVLRSIVHSECAPLIHYVSPQMGQASPHFAAASRLPPGSMREDGLLRPSFSRSRPRAPAGSRTGAGEVEPALALENSRAGAQRAGAAHPSRRSAAVLGHGRGSSGLSSAAASTDRC